MSLYAYFGSQSSSSPYGSRRSTGWQQKVRFPSATACFANIVRSLLLYRNGSPFLSTARYEFVQTQRNFFFKSSFVIFFPFCRFGVGRRAFIANHLKKSFSAYVQSAKAFLSNACLPNSSDGRARTADLLIDALPAELHRLVLLIIIFFLFFYCSENSFCSACP